jgi:hypothetical protein
MASTLVVASIARSGAQPNATTSPIPSAILRKRLAVTALTKRLVAEGALSTASFSAPGKKLRSKMVWTDRAPIGCCFALAPSTLRPAAGPAISLSGAQGWVGRCNRDASSGSRSLRISEIGGRHEDGAQLGCEGMRCDENDGRRRVSNALETTRAAAPICRAASKEMNNRIAQIIAIRSDRSFSAKPTELYAASASPRTTGCQPTDSGGESELPNPKIIGLLRLDWPKSICRAPTSRIAPL